MFFLFFKKKFKFSRRIKSLKKISSLSRHGIFPFFPPQMVPSGKASKVDVIDAYQVLNSLNYIKKNPKEIQNGVLSAESAFELFKSLGVRKEKLKDICDLSAGIQTYDEEGFDQIMEDLKTKSRTHGDMHMKSVFKTNSSMKNHPSTKDKWKYEYTKVDANR